SDGGRRPACRPGRAVRRDGGADDRDRRSRARRATDRRARRREAAPRAARRLAAVTAEPFRSRRSGHHASVQLDGGFMGIIAFLILGLLAGAIAKAILPGDDPGGILITMLIGVVGALLGGFLAAALFNAHPLDDFFDLSTWITAIIGAIIVL